MLRDGTLEIKGENLPEFANNTKEIIQECERNFKLEAFSKPDYFACAGFVDGLISSQEFSKKGM